MSTKSARADTGARRVAALLLSLDQNSASALLKTLSPDVLPRVADAMTAVEAEGPDSPARSGIWRDLVREIEHGHVEHPHARDEAELGRFLEASLGRERATSVLTEMRERRRLERPFAAIESAAPAHVAKALANESTAARTLVLGNLPPKLAAGVLALLDPDESLAVVQRISRQGTPRRETIDMVAKNITAEVERIATEPMKPRREDRLRSIAEILNGGDKEFGRNVLTGLDDADKPAAESIRELMFTWNDLAKLDRRAMQKVLSTVETGKLAMALKGGPIEVEENVLANLSQRVRDMVAEERELFGPRPRSEVEAARAELMKGIRSLVESGDLSTSVSAEGMVN
jgi:flagellar motor switch protein FliG